MHDFVPAGFFVLRTPLLPFDELAAWGASAASSAAPLPGVGALRERLRRVAEDSDVQEALFLASPSLLAGLVEWRRHADGKKGRRAEEALVRYFTRMTSRPTPFGLFAGCALGHLGDRTRLRLAERRRYRRQTRLDMDHLFRLQQALGRYPPRWRSLRFRPNSSLYRSGGRLRYVESQLRDGVRSHHLVAVDPDPFVDCALAAAGGGATIGELARQVAAADPAGEVSPEEAEEYVGELIGNQLLVSAVSVSVTGGDATADLVRQLREEGAPPELADTLDEVVQELAALDRAGLGAPPSRYEAVAARLAELPAEVEPSRLFQVDMTKPVVEATLARDVIAELERGIDALHRISPPPRNDQDLSAFRAAFVERYGERRVPLLAALDDELGLSFGPAPGRDFSPLLAGLDLAGRREEVGARRGPFEDLLASEVERALAGGESAIELSEDRLARLDGAPPAPMPDTFEAVASIAASPEALEHGHFRILLRSASGPGGARLLGRFCHADAALRAQVEHLLRSEERLLPDAVFAEVVHLPEGRVGNVLARPVLREHEITLLGRGGAPEERQIPAADLVVSVAGDEILLHCGRSGRRVIPRLTTAHNFWAGGLPVYRFLCALQGQGVQTGLAWSWGALEALSFLPRVSVGRVVLARARWRVEVGEIAALESGHASDRLRELEAWRRRRRLPRWVVLPDADHELVVDLENPLSVEAWLALVRGGRRVTLAELFPGPDELCVTGPEGRFVHEIVVPFIRRREPTPLRGRRPVLEPVRRSFPPGSEWLYAKVYTGTATADAVLRELVARVVRPALVSAAVDRWFFLRYADDGFHLRLRLHGDPGRLHQEVLPALTAAAALLFEDGRAWRVQLDTYERELERYGGPLGIALAERLFHADSEAVVALLEPLKGEEGQEAVWRLAFCGIDRLLGDFGLSPEERLGTVERMAASLAREHRADARLRKQLASRLRAARPELERLLGPVNDPGHQLAPALAVLDRRSHDVAPIVAEMREHEAAGRLTLPLAEMVPSFTHMFVNRLLRAEPQAHEMVLYDFLYRLHLARTRRTRLQGGSEPE